MMEEKTANFSFVNKTAFLIDNDKDMQWLETFNSSSFDRFIIFIDSNVEDLWGDFLMSKFRKHKKEYFIFNVPPKEKSKSLVFYPKVVKFLEENRVSRFDIVLAIGGGIVIDLVSFVVSTYMRGLPLYAIPTTLIGQVDATTAGKTCLNTQSCKNLLGTFYYPLVVYNNIHFLSTNSEKYLRQGYSEIFKYALLGSKALLDLLVDYRKNPNDNLLMKIISSTIDVRVAIRKKDPLASNLGHTFGHAIERLSNYKILHGDAITAGTVLALNFAKEVNLIKEEAVNEIITMMKKLQLNIYLDEDLNIDTLIHHMMHDKKSSVDNLNLVLITDIEQPYEQDNNLFYSTSPVILKEFLKEFLKNYKYRISNCANFIKENKLYYEGQK